MKRSEEIKIIRTGKLTRMQAILDGAREGQNVRALNEAEQTEYNTLRTEVESLERHISEAEFAEQRAAAPASAHDATQHQRSSTGVHIGRSSAPYSVGKAIREYMRSGAQSLTGLEAEMHQELSRGISSSGLLVPYQYQRTISANTTTTHASSIDVVIDANLSIIGKEPLWQQMGLTVLPGLTGQVKLGKKTADQAEKVAETTAISTESNVPSHVTMAAERYGISDLFTKELLAQENPAVQAQIIADMIKSCDRQITAEVYTIALAAATEVATGAISTTGFNALMNAVDLDGAFAMTRESFFEVKGTKVDTGSGIFLATMGANNGVGVTYDGVPVYYSTLFSDGSAKQYLIYGAWSEIYVGLWGALEILVNPYTYQKQGEIEITVNKLADVICRNSGAFVRTPDLDSGT